MCLGRSSTKISPGGFEALGGFSHHFNPGFRNTIPTIKAVKWLGAYRTPNTTSVALTIVTNTWIRVGTIQVQIVATAAIVRSRRPIVAIGTTIVHRATVDVAGINESPDHHTLPNPKTR